MKSRKTITISALLFPVVLLAGCTGENTDTTPSPAPVESKQAGEDGAPPAPETTSEQFTVLPDNELVYTDESLDETLECEEGSVAISVFKNPDGSLNTYECYTLEDLEERGDAQLVETIEREKQTTSQPTEPHTG